MPGPRDPERAREVRGVRSGSVLQPVAARAAFHAFSVCTHRAGRILRGVLRELLPRV